MTRSEAQCYRTLGLTTAASMDEIKKAYRSIARKIHPDRSPGKEEQFKEVTAAYNELVDRHGRGKQRPSGRGGVRGTPRTSARAAHRAGRGASGVKWGPWKPENAETTKTSSGRSGGPEARQKPGAAHRRPAASEATKQRARAARKQAEARRKQERAQARSTQQSQGPTDANARTKGSTQQRKGHFGAKAKGQGQASRPEQTSSKSTGPNRTRARRTTDKMAGATAGAKRARRDTKASESRHNKRRYADEADFWSEQNLGARPEPKRATDPDDFNAAWRAWCESAQRYHAEHGQDEVVNEPEPVLEPEADDSERAGAGKRLVEWVRRGLRRVRSAQPAQDGEDVVLRLAVSVDQLFHGAELRIAALRPVACPSCQGGGDAGCVCDGNGRIRIRDEVPVTLPPGARSGLKLRVAGKGGDGLGDGKNGDLLLYLDPPELPGFRREGLNLHGTVYVSRRMARVGGTVQLELPRGCVNVKVPPQSRNGDRFRLRGQGIPVWGGGEKGDMVLSVVVR